MAEAPEPTPATDAVKALASFLHESPTERPSREQIQIELRKAGADMGVLRRSVQDTFKPEVSNGCCSHAASVSR